MSIEITDQGPIVSDTAEVKEEVTEVFRTALGQEMNVNDNTPQGQLITSLTNIITDKDAALLFIMNMIDPRTASGKWQEAIGEIYFVTRNGETYTVVDVVCRGAAGTYIPGRGNAQGAALVRSTNNDIFICDAGGTIGADSTVTLSFTAQESGPVPAEAGSLNQIYKAIPGWDSCTNPEAGIIGRPVESRAEYQQRLIRSVAKNATGSVSAIYANVAALEGVSSCGVWENVGSTYKLIGNVRLNPHSIYVSVVGGDDQEIAQQIYNRKSAGCDMNGNTEVPIEDIPSGAIYNIYFERAEAVAIKVQVTVTTASMISVTTDQIIDAIYNNFNDGSNPVNIGDPVYASRFYCSLSPFGVDVVSIEVGAVGGAFANLVTTEINQIATLDRANITVVLS